MRSFLKGLLLAGAALVGIANSTPLTSELTERAAAGPDRLVFCHFMIGIVANRNSPADYDDDMRRAKAAGIDAFALNIGVDPYTDQQLELAYQSAANNGIKVFISFDFNWYKPYEADRVGQMIKKYGSLPAQLYVDGRVFASSFSGDGLDVAAMRRAAGSNVFFVPNFHPGQGDVSQIDGALNWMGWDNDGNNKAPSPNKRVTVEDGDNEYTRWLGSGKYYMAPVSPWFSTHFGPEVPYSKNWVFPGGALIFDRWKQVLAKGFPMVEIVTWNDYGESHYVGPLSSPHYDDGNSKWVNDMPHNGWLDLSKPFIAAYKAKATSVNSYIQSDQIIYWYRRHLNSLNCDVTDTTSGRPADNSSGNYFMGKPNGWQSMEDVVYVATLFKEAGEVTVTSGGNSKVQQVAAGANLFTIPAGLGQQKFTLSRGGRVIMSETSLMNIENVCPCGIYNYNPYVGQVPAGFSDPLQPQGINSLTVGLHVSTCAATPSLGTAAPPPPVTTTATSTRTTSSTSMSTTTRPTSTTSTTRPPVTSSTTSQAPPPPSTTCIRGTVADGQSGNFIGLCEFSCRYNYCPPGPCKCLENGAQIPAPPLTNTPGCPLPGEPDSYKGLCSFTCTHGYCPPTACQRC